MAKNPMRKWAAHTEWCYERQGLPMAVLKRSLKCTERTIRSWDNGSRPIPHWAPMVLRLNRYEKAVMLAQMTGQEAVPLKGLMYIDPPTAPIRVTPRMSLVA